MLIMPADGPTSFPFPIHYNYQILMFLNMVDNKMQQTVDQSPAIPELDYGLTPQSPFTTLFTSLPLA
jgi:hypothetical protein